MAIERDYEEIDFLVITILDIETNAVNKFGFKSLVDRNGRGYYRKEHFNSVMNREISIVHYSVGEQGNVSSGVLVSDLLNFWRPRCVCVVGIAGGIKRNDAKIGDVLIGNQIFYYPLSKETPDATERRPEVVRGDSSILSQIRSFKDHILSHLTNQITKIPGISGMSPNILIGPIFSGESVQASKIKTEELLKIHPKGIGVEMESYGVYLACANNQFRPRTLTIRSVSDLADEVKNDDFHQLAAYSAALFFIAIVQLCDLRFIDSYSEIPSIPEKAILMNSHTDYSNIFEVTKNGSDRLFSVQGKSDFFDLRPLIFPYTLKCWIYEEYAHKEDSAIQVGVDLDITGLLRRENRVGYASISFDIVVLNAYRYEVARTTISGYPKTIGNLLAKLIEPLELDVSEQLSNETHYPIVGLFNFPVPLESGPYWIGIECNIGLSHGGSIGGRTPIEEMKIKINKIVVSPHY